MSLRSSNDIDTNKNIDINENDDDDNQTVVVVVDKKIQSFNCNRIKKN